MAQINRYNKKISGPLIDRIDLFINVTPVKHDKLLSGKADESSQIVAKRIANARQIQHKRNVTDQGSSLNASLSPRQIKQVCQLDESCQALARQALASLGLSARGYTRTLKVALTITDLAGSDSINVQHLAEALPYRSR